MALPIDAAPDGATLDPLWALPFGGLLLSIALMPMVAPHFWHRHYGRIAIAWILALIVPFLWAFGPLAAAADTVHAIAHEYVPFIALLGALYVIGGGIRLTRTPSGTPTSNTFILLLGTLLASLIGTTGAAMVLIRPLLRANGWRRRNVHVVIFFIFLVGNIGGSLTPIGDPPLFLGYLRGVSFFWPVQYLAGPMFLIAAVLLALFWCIDRWMLRGEGAPPHRPPHDPTEGTIEGWWNVVLLLAVIATVLISGSVHSGIELDLGLVSMSLEEVGRILVLATIGWLSFRMTSPGLRQLNEFDWGPIREVAILFFGLFLTITPVLAMLQAGRDGPFAGAIDVLTRGGQPNKLAYFWVTGLLSSVLDNAPTYLVFFETAGGDPAVLQGQLADTLRAISAGAVFMGALTYIGNAPNFMVRAIAEGRGVAMPSFFGYLVWSLLFLTPLFVLVSLVWF